MHNKIFSELTKIKKHGLLRTLVQLLPLQNSRAEISGKLLINFSSNDYLSLSKNPSVIESACSAAKEFGSGSCASRLICGNYSLHKELEEKLASFKGTESALVFPSGFQANCGTLSAIAGIGDCIIMDEYNHASLWEGAKLSKSRIFAYKHKNIESLEKILKRSKTYKTKFIVTDSVFSMDGDLAPLKEIFKLAKTYDATVIVDEAHAIGVFGKNGAGLCETLNIKEENALYLGTLSKALGSQGGFVCGSKELIEFIINRCRAFIYSTSLAPACAGAALKAIDLTIQSKKQRNDLLTKAQYLRNQLNQMGFDTLKSESQIIPILVGDSLKALDFSKILYENGIFAPAIRPPTVPDGTARIRISLNSSHTDEDIEKLIEAIQSARAIQ